MQDHKRAVVVGQHSYGKASVQSLIPLPDGSGLRLTVAHYYTPNGRMIHRDGKNKNWGIMPDIVVDVKPETGGQALRAVGDDLRQGQEAGVCGQARGDGP